MIKQYIEQSDEKIRPYMKQVYDLIITNSPPLKESMKWGMPTFELNGNLIHFARAKNHLGIYPGPTGVEYLKEDLDQKGYKYSKGAIQIPLDKPLDTQLLLKLLKFKLKEHQTK